MTLSRSMRTTESQETVEQPVAAVHGLTKNGCAGRLTVGGSGFAGYVIRRHTRSGHRASIVGRGDTARSVGVCGRFYSRAGNSFRSEGRRKPNQTEAGGSVTGVMAALGGNEVTYSPLIVPLTRRSKAAVVSVVKYRHAMRPASHNFAADRESTTSGVTTTASPPAAAPTERKP